MVLLHGGILMSDDYNWDSGFNSNGSGNPWDFEPKDPLKPNQEEEQHAFGNSDVPPWPSRNYDGSPERDGCLGAFVGMIALPLATLLGAVLAVLN